MNREAERRLLETAFEPHGDGYLFYRNRWSSGIPVTAAEREQYLAIPALGSRKAFYLQIEGRTPATGPRNASDVRGRMISAIPLWSLIVAVALGIAILLSARSVESSAVRHWLDLVSGGFLTLVGGWLLLARLLGRR